MITFEQIREKYPPRQVGTQQEFDTAMHRMRQAQSDLTQPLRTESEMLNARRREIGRQMAQLNLELSSINRRRDEILNERREIGCIFYGLKKELIRLNPKRAATMSQQRGQEEQEEQEGQAVQAMAQQQ